jgi:uncharacterized protein YdeI (YjbR/CyaY-like superfamily)
MKATFFSSGADFRRWLEEHSARSTELWVGYFKAGSGKASLTWPESVDQALCYGWIDGIRKSIDEARYMIRCRHLVGRECKEGRNTQAAAEAVNRRLVAWKTNKAVSETVGGITIQCRRSWVHF